MMIRRPNYWDTKQSLALLLLPLSIIWWLGSILRQSFTQSYRAKLPVICIGNLSVGGTGKTPAAVLVANILRQQGWKPALLSRGYGGNISGPSWVNSDKHTANEVGDEPLFLSRHLPVCIARHRGQGAQFIEADKSYDIIVMDDGLQNPSLQKDIIIGLFDGGVGIGNGWLLPAGPMRERFSSSVHKLDLILMNGTDETNLKAKIPAEKPIFDVLIKPSDTANNLHGKRCIAFAGIGRPERFFQTLHELGANIVEQQAFPDHHSFHEDELAKLEHLAQIQGANLITTEKDWYRLSSDWRSKISPLPISMILTKTAETKFVQAIKDKLNHVISQ